MNATGRVGTGLYSDRIGRANAYLVNGVISAACLFLMPTIMASGNVPLLFLAVGVAYWQYGGGLALMPAFTADYFGPKNLGLQLRAGLHRLGYRVLRPAAGRLHQGRDRQPRRRVLSLRTLLVAAVVLSRFLKRPMTAGESPGAA